MRRRKLPAWSWRGSDAPASFVAFVAAHGTDLGASLAELTGNSQVAEQLRVQLLAAVGLRWRWYEARGGARAAAAYLDRLLRRESRSWERDRRGVGRRGAGRRGVERRGVERRGGHLSDGDAAESDRASSATDHEPARQVWQRAVTMRRRRYAAAAAVVLVLALMWIVTPLLRPDPVAEDAEPPPGLTVLEPYARLSELALIPTALPRRIAMDPAGVPDLAGAPPIKAVSAIMRSGDGPIILLASDGMRRVFADARLDGARLHTTSLAPGGTRAVLSTAEGLLVLDIASASLRPITLPPAALQSLRLAWRSPSLLIVPGPDGALQVDTDSGQIVSLPRLTGRDVLSSVDASDDRLVEMLGPTVRVDRGRLRIWGGEFRRAVDDDRSQPRPTPSATATQEFSLRSIGGPSWLNDCAGTGLILFPLIARECSPAHLAVPESIGTPHSAVAMLALDAHLGTLMTVDDSVVEPVGLTRGWQTLLAVHAPQAPTLILSWNPEWEPGHQLRLVSIVDAPARVSLSCLAVGSRACGPPLR